MIIIIKHLVSCPDTPYKISAQSDKRFWIKVENRFSRWQPWCHIEYKIDTILKIKHLVVALMFQTIFQLNPTSSGEKSKSDIQNGNLTEYQTDTILRYKHPLFAPIFHIKFPFNRSMGSGAEVETLFSKLPPSQSY